MPLNKNAYHRYRVIDSCLTNHLKPYPSLEYITKKVSASLDAGKSKAERTGISSSMISKDITEMKRNKEINAPIEFSREHRGYYYTEKGFSLKERPWTYKEMDALEFSTAFLSKIRGSSFYENFESAINKAIGQIKVTQILELSESQILQTEEPINNTGVNYIERILKAIVEKECIEIIYQSYQKPETMHHFSPYIIKEYQGRWYAIGYSAKGKKILSLGLDRIKGINKLPRDTFFKYYKEPGFSEDDYFNYCLGIMKNENDKPEKIVLEFSEFQIPYVLSQPLHKSQRVIEQTNDKLIIELEVYMTHELMKLILSYGEQVKVLEPEKIINRIREILVINMSLYQN